MTTIVAISASPAPQSRSRFLLQSLATPLQHEHIVLHEITLQTLPPAQLLTPVPLGDEVAAAIALIERADAVIVATPVYKAAYSGLLKVFLDLLPQTAFAGKVILPIGTAGSPSHLLALEYALKPVLSALGARHVLGGIYASDADLPLSADRYGITTKLRERLDEAIEELLHALEQRASVPARSTRVPLALASRH